MKEKQGGLFPGEHEEEAFFAGGKTGARVADSRVRSVNEKDDRVPATRKIFPEIGSCLYLG